MPKMAPTTTRPAQIVNVNTRGKKRMKKPLKTAETYPQMADANTAIAKLTRLVLTVWRFIRNTKSKTIAPGTNPKVAGGPPASKEIAEPIIPTNDAAPNCPVAQTTRRSVKKIMTL